VAAETQAKLRDIPIIFSAPMIRALMEGRKTMTRRLARQEVELTNDAGSAIVGGQGATLAVVAREAGRSAVGGGELPCSADRFGDARLLIF
jgi:hypothetical protein